MRNRQELVFAHGTDQILAPIASKVLEKDGVRSFELPTRMPINEFVWGLIREQLCGINATLWRNLVLAGTVTPFLNALEQLSDSLKHLYFVEAARPPESERTVEQRMTMHHLESPLPL